MAQLEHSCFLQVVRTLMACVRQQAADFSLLDGGARDEGAALALMSRPLLSVYARCKCR